jgi:hypothetical protein
MIPLFKQLIQTFDLETMFYASYVDFADESLDWLHGPELSPAAQSDAYTG